MPADPLTPANRNATLEDMDRVFKSRTGEADRKLLAECRTEVGLDVGLETVAVEEAKRSPSVDQKDEESKMESS